MKNVVVKRNLPNPYGVNLRNLSQICGILDKVVSAPPEKRVPYFVIAIDYVGKADVVDQPVFESNNEFLFGLFVATPRQEFAQICQRRYWVAQKLSEFQQSIEWYRGEYQVEESEISDALLSKDSKNP